MYANTSSGLCCGSDMLALGNRPLTCAAMSGCAVLISQNSSSFAFSAREGTVMPSAATEKRDVWNFSDLLAVSSHDAGRSVMRVAHCHATCSSVRGTDDGPSQALACSKPDLVV